MDAKKQTLTERTKNAGASFYRTAMLGSGAVLMGLSQAHANSDTSIDLTTGLAGVAIVGGLMAAGSLKALPTYVSWGIRKALSMLR